MQAAKPKVSIRFRVAVNAKDVGDTGKLYDEAIRCRHSTVPMYTVHTCTCMLYQLSYQLSCDPTPYGDMSGGPGPPGPLLFSCFYFPPPARPLWSARPPSQREFNLAPPRAGSHAHRAHHQHVAGVGRRSSRRITSSGSGRNLHACSGPSDSSAKGKKAEGSKLSLMSSGQTSCVVLQISKCGANYSM